MPRDLPDRLAARASGVQASFTCSLAVALHFVHYNFCRIHQTLRVTPAMEAGITDHVWDVKEIVELLDAERRQVA